MSFKFLLCSPLWLPLSVVLFPPGFLLCAPPLCYHTWPPPSSLSSPVPRWFISVCVFSLCVPFTPRPVIVCICLFLLMCLLLSVSSLFLSFPSSSWYVFLDFEFCILVCSLSCCFLLSLLCLAGLICNFDFLSWTVFVPGSLVFCIQL